MELDEGSEGQMMDFRAIRSSREAPQALDYWDSQGGACRRPPALAELFPSAYPALTETPPLECTPYFSRQTGRAFSIQDSKPRFIQGSLNYDFSQKPLKSHCE